MKNMKIKVIGTLVFVLGAALAVTGVASASTADTIQPAGDIEYTETVIVPSIKVGKQGVGGVTFFNGTIVNNTTDDGVDNPVTFGDNVRIDGEIFRTEKGGDNALKVSDDLNPTLDAINNFGSVTNQWKDGYFSGTLNVGALGGTGVVATGNLADSSVTSTKIAAGTIVGSDISSSADLSVSSVTATKLVGNGAVKALVYVASTGSCTRSWTYNDSAVTCTRNGQGDYWIDFAFDVNSRYWQVTPATLFMGSDFMVTTSNDLGNDIIRITLSDENGAVVDGNSMLVVY